MRTITAEAGVDLGSIRYHFGSKDVLFGEVLRRRLDPLCQERLDRLDAARQAAGGAAPGLEAIIEAFLAPGLRLVRDKQHGQQWRRLIGWARLEPGEYLASVQDTYKRLLERFREAFRQALPELPEKELAYRFYFLFVNIDGTLRAMEGLSDLSEDDNIVERLINFVAAGMRAPVGRSVGRHDLRASGVN